jgi:hypothetical protein
VFCVISCKHISCKHMSCKHVVHLFVFRHCVYPLVATFVFRAVVATYINPSAYKRVAILATKQDPRLELRYPFTFFMCRPLFQGTRGRLLPVLKSFPVLPLVTRQISALTTAFCHAFSAYIWRGSLDVMGGWGEGEGGNCECVI